jgi:hypothetical protein
MYVFDPVFEPNVIEVTQNCHRPGHFARDCPGYTSMKGPVKCYKCGGLNHISAYSIRQIFPNLFSYMLLLAIASRTQLQLQLPRTRYVTNAISPDM